MCENCSRTDASESEMLEMTSEKLFGHNAYIEIFQAGECPDWTYRLSMEKPVCRLVCREHPYTKGVKGEKFAFDVDKTLAIGLFKKFSKFQLRLSPKVSPFPCFEYGEFRLMIGSDYGSIKVEWSAPDEDNGQIEEFVEEIDEMVSRLIDLQRESPDMKIRLLRFCQIHCTGSGDGRANIEKTIGLRYTGHTVYALDSDNHDFGQFSPEDSAFILANIGIDRQLKVCADDWFGESDDSAMDALVLEYTPRSRRTRRSNIG